MLDIIIPVYNEGVNILKLLELFNKQVKSPFNILICYDSYEDTTLKIINNNYTKSNIRFIKNEQMGPNSAILTGIKQSKADVIVVYMSDDLFNVGLIDKMYEYILNGYDLIIPSRFINGGKFEGATFYKKIITILGSILINRVAGIPYKDCTNAFKMFKKNLFKKIKLNSKFGFTYALELTIKCNFNKSKIKEIPSVWQELEGRKSNFKIFKWIPYYSYWLIYAFIKRFNFF